VCKLCVFAERTSSKDDVNSLAEEAKDLIVTIARNNNSKRRGEGGGGETLSLLL
jgi:hypothetical protein